VIEIAALVVAVGSVFIGVRVNRIAKLLEEREQREQQKQRVRSLEQIKP